jgi:asparagine synthetase B (glutamine-hydrolysing)
MGAHIQDLLHKGQASAAANEIERFAEINGISAIAAYRKVMSSMAAIWNTGWSADGSSYLRRECLSSSLADNGKPAFEHPFDSELLNILHRDLLHTKLPRILRACDRASMAYGRELRVPVLDHRLVEYVMGLPNEFKIKDGVQRAFYRAALANVFKTPLSNVPKKAVVDPQRDWLRGPLRSWAGDILASRSFAERGLFDVTAVRREFDLFCSGEYGTGNSFYVWQWLSVELWYRTFIDGS